MEIATNTTFELSFNINRAKELVSKSVSKNTKKAYKKDFEQFALYCSENNIDLNDKKQQEWALLAFASSYFDNRKAKTSTIKRKVYSIASVLDIEPSRAFKKVLAGIQNENIENGNTEEMTKAVSMDMLRDAIIKRENKKNYNRDRALILCLFFGAFRVSELLTAKRSHLTKTNTAYELKIYGTKTNKSEQGQLKLLPFRDDSLCVGSALDIYLNESDFDTLFNMTRMQANRIVKKWFGADYSSHSLRTGFITEAVAKGIDKKAIKNQTGHKTDVMIDHYTKDDRNRRRNAASMM